MKELYLTSLLKVIGRRLNDMTQLECEAIELLEYYKLVEALKNEGLEAKVCCEKAYTVARRFIIFDVSDKELNYLSDIDCDEDVAKFLNQHTYTVKKNASDTEMPIDSLYSLKDYLICLRPPRITVGTDKDYEILWNEYDSSWYDNN